MAHTPHEVLSGITLPSKTGIVTGRVNAWLSEKSEDIEAASCYVSAVSYPVKHDDISIINLFVEVAWKLQANGGVNVWLDGIEDILEELKNLNPLDMGLIFTEPQERVKIDHTFKVADSLRLEKFSSIERYPEHISIYDSWVKTWHAILLGENIYLDFSDVREEDEKSSGRASFIAILVNFIEIIYNPTIETFLIALSKVNGLIKKGGFRKQGAVTTSYSLINKYNKESSLFNDYLNISFDTLPYVKKAIIIPKPEDLTGDKSLILNAHLSKIISKYNAGEIFIDKSIDDYEGKPLVSNVCRGISLTPQDQCLIGHINLGMIEDISRLEAAFTEETKFILNVYQLQIDRKVHMVDKQIAIGVTGLANFLRNHKVTYSAFIEMLYKYSNCITTDLDRATKPYKIVYNLFKGFNTAARIGEDAGMRATLAIEPCESCSRRYKDYKGFDIVPNIDPPNVIKGVGVEKRHSDTGLVSESGEKITPLFNYGADIETTSDITFDEHFELWNCFQNLMNFTGQAHMSSYEHWGEMDLFKFYRWFKSNIKTLYYKRSDIGTTHLDKGNTLKKSFQNYQNQTGCLSCGD